MPQIIPIKELKNTANISEMCKASREPIYITKNGYGDMVIMNQEVFERMQSKTALASILNDASDAYENGAKTFDGESVFKELRNQYGKAQL